MSCPTCDHTMHSVSRVRGIFWCPRCGTVKIVEPDATYVPRWSEERATTESLDKIAGPQLPGQGGATIPPF